MKQLSEYNISAKTGCILEHPLTRLPPSFAPWQDIMDNMWTLLAEKRVREKVHELPVLDTSELKTYEELCLAHLQLAMISAAYVWQDGDAGVAKVLPRAAAVPLWSVSERLGLPPLMNYSDVVLMNCIVDYNVPEDGPRTDRMKTIYTFTPIPEWKAFNAVTGTIELQFAKAVPLIVEAATISRNADCNPQELARLLNEVAALTESMTPVMESYRKCMDPDIFFTKMLPILGGWDESSKVLPKGLVYEGVSEEPQPFTAASAGQSLILQANDCLLGNKHPEAAAQRLEVMKRHMLSGHRQFLTDLRDFSKVSERMAAGSDPALIEAFNRLERSVRTFRSSHVGMVSSYVVTPSRKVFPPEAVEEDNKKLIGYLKSLRESTEGHLLQEGDKDSGRKA